jgi:hypothetical protein
MMKNISKLINRLPALNRVVPQYCLQTSTTYNKKLGIGEASVVLEEKIKNIS